MVLAVHKYERSSQTKGFPLIQVRYSTAPTSAETATTADLRDRYLVQDLFVDGEVRATYTHEDRLLVGGAVPGTGQLDLPAWTEVLGRMSLSTEDVDLGAVSLTNLGPGIYSGQVVLPTAGSWEVQVSLRTSEFDNPVRTVTFEVP